MSLLQDLPEGVAAAALLGLPALGLGAAARLEGRSRPRAAGVCRRASWLVLTTLAVFSLSFVVMRAAPGGPFDEDRPLSPEVRRALDRRYGFDRPLPEQWFRALDGLARLDLGPSLTLRDLDVLDVIRQGAGPSFLLGTAAFGWTLLLGLPLGIVAALRKGRAADAVASTVAALGLAIPGFVLASLLLIPFAFSWGILPAAGLGSVRALLLPSFCLGIPYAAQVARLSRASLIEALAQDWIRTARAKGLSPRQVVLGHALRGALVPVVVSLGPALAGILTGSLVIEQMFAIPGLGTHFVQSALSRDYPLAMGMVVLFTVLVYLLNWAADGLQSVLDPRSAVP